MSSKTASDLLSLSGLDNIDLGKIDIVKTSLAFIGVLVASLVIILILRRLRRPTILRLGEGDGKCGICARVWAWIRRFLDSIDYLATRREWRYQQPWLLVLGEQGAGKSSLIASVSSTWRHQPPRHADKLQANGMHWSYFRYGVLIDGDGKLASAEQGSDPAKQWAKGLSQLNELRPERPLDGIVLCVSARTLLNTKQSQRAALAENVNRQISLLQTSVEFMLPAYVVVTQCDVIPGFTAFWRSQDSTRRGEMVGYSAIAQDQTLQPSGWAESALDMIGARMREVQVDVAALSEAIEDVDGFLLFPGHFRSLRDPLAQWLETVFCTTAWQSGYLFRGMYFTGSLEAGGAYAEGRRNDVDFVDAMVSEKMLREPALAKPTRKGIWSRNTLIRNMQITAVAISLGLYVALGFAGYRVSRQVDLIVGGIESLRKVAPRVPDAGSGECMASKDIFPLIEYVSRINARSRYLVIPLSWVDGRPTSGSAAVIGRTVVQKVLMPTLSCVLEQRAREMLASTHTPAKGNASVLSQQRADFRKLIADARALEENIIRFETLSDSNNALDEHELFSMLDLLMRYAYDEALPADAWREAGVLDDAFRHIADVQQPVMPRGLHARLAAAMEARSVSLRAALSREVSIGDDLMALLDEGQPPILDNTRRMGIWLAWVQRSWLGSSAERNPCQEIVNANKTDVDTLVAHYGNISSLDGMLQRFSAKACYQPEMDVLATMTMAPYGPMFVTGKGGLVMAPELQGELSGLPALVTLPFMQLKSTLPFACVGAAAEWRANEIAEAAGYLGQYEAFAKSRKLSVLPDGARPLYDTLARASLSHALDDALRRAQRVPPDSQTSLVAIRTNAQSTRVGDELARGMGSLKTVLNAYVTYGFSDGGADVRACARALASDNLGGVDALADSSLLYAPTPAVGTNEMFTFGGLSATKDYLARNVARAEVLADYADPFLAVLRDTPGVDDAWRDAPQTAAFWSNTRDEIDRYTKGKEPAGQVANLDAYFIAQLSGMTYANCASVLAAYSSPEYGNDIFSDRRRKLERQVQLRCSDQRQAQAEVLYSALATRFNRELAGRYPFGDLSARDASLAVTRKFFLDYADQRESLAAAMGTMNNDHWRSAKSFIVELNNAADFFASHVSAPGEMDVVGLTTVFPAEPSRSVGGDQILAWHLEVEGMESVFPNGLKPLQWYPGDTIALNLRWASRSQWRPQPDAAQADLSVHDARATFISSGPWALLRFIDTYSLPSNSAREPDRILLGFSVPVQSLVMEKDGKPPRSEAKVFMTWLLTDIDPKTQSAKTIALPADFPRSAPMN